MNGASTFNAEDAETRRYQDSTPVHRGPLAGNCSDRLVELELENVRLHRLVAELLIKNQQLRKPD